MPPGTGGKQQQQRRRSREGHTQSNPGTSRNDELRSSVQSINDAPFRPKGTWQKKGQKPGRAVEKSLPGTAEKIRITEQSRSRNSNSRKGHEVSGFGGADVLTLRNDTPSDMPGMFASGGIAPDWDASGRPTGASRDASSAFRDVEASGMRISTGHLLDDGRGTSRSGQRSGATARRAMPMMPGAQLSPLPNQGERVEAQRMKLPAMGGPEPPGSPRRATNSKLQPMHFNPQVQVIDGIVAPQVDLLTMSPSQAQQHLQTERIKRKQSGRDSRRRSSLSKGVVFGDTARHSELETELSESGRFGPSMRSSHGNLSRSSQFGTPSQSLAASSGAWGTFASSLPHELLGGVPEDPGDPMMRSYDNKHTLGMKMSRMQDQANAVEAKQQAREDEIMRQVKYGLPGMHL